MADQQQLELLRQGVNIWHAWRREHPEIDPDLSYTDLSHANLRRANLRQTNLRRTDLRHANLNRADLRQAYLRHADLRKATLSGANLSEADLSDVNLSEAYLGEAYLSKANLSEADLSQADLSQVLLSYADLSRAILNRTDLNRADLSYTNFCGADLSYANLSHADLSHADLSYADLSDVDLSHADFSRVILNNTRLAGTRLDFAMMERTIFGSIDLRTVKGLGTIEHRGPSIIGIDTVLRSEGNIPEVFLRGTGASDTFIDYVRSLTQQPIVYSTCFIGYSAKDQEFAQRLYTDLQSKGVRCWFVPKNMHTGDKIGQHLDESISMQDKLLLVLSQSSIRSSWVEFVVEAALAKENRRNPQVLFPIRLDDAVVKSKRNWAVRIRQTRHITDFTCWKQQDDYQQAFVRLLSDLQQSTT